jgi:hypothetical protein
LKSLPPRARTRTRKNAAAAFVAKKKPSPPGLNFFFDPKQNMPSLATKKPAPAAAPTSTAAASLSSSSFAIASAVGALPPPPTTTAVAAGSAPPASLVKWGPVLETPLGQDQDDQDQKGPPPTLLDRLLPPRRWRVAVAATAAPAAETTPTTTTPQLIVVREQRVSAEPATRADAVALARDLDARLLAEGARPKGLCPVRSRLHAQALDELVRQSATACAERGSLLLRVRDEHRETVRALEKVRAAAARFAVRQAAASEQRAAELERRASEAEARAAEAEGERDALALRCAQVEKEAGERLARLEAERRVEVAFLSRRCEGLERAAGAGG